MRFGLLGVGMGVLLLFPAPALASCAAESLAVSQIGFERIPGDQLSRQIHEARKSKANSDLARCIKAERLAKREAEQAVAEEAARYQALSAQAARVENERRYEAQVHGLISRAILEKRCGDAKQIALEANRLDLAEQAVRLCVPTP